MRSEAPLDLGLRDRNQSSNLWRNLISQNSLDHNEREFTDSQKASWAWVWATKIDHPTYAELRFLEILSTITHKNLHTTRRAVGLGFELQRSLVLPMERSWFLKIVSTITDKRLHAVRSSLGLGFQRPKAIILPMEKPDFPKSPRP